MKEENEDPMSIVKNSAYSSAIFEFLINHHAKVLVSVVVVIYVYYVTKLFLIGCST